MSQHTTGLTANQNRGRPNDPTNPEHADRRATPPTVGSNAAPERPRAPALRKDLLVVLAATVAGLLTWALWTQAGSAELAVRSGERIRHIGGASVLVTSVVVGLVAVGLARLLQSRADRGMRWWTITAAAVWAISLLGPLGALTATAGVALATLHLLVGGIVLFGVRAVRRAR